MSSILAIETSAHIGAIALMPDDTRPDKVFCELVRDEAKLSAWVLPAIERVQAAANLSLRDVDAVAFGAGPGSFTGVRTACATAQALAYAWQKPLIKVDSLEALADACSAARISVVLDARMNEVFAASFARGASGVLVRLSATTIGPPQSFQAAEGALLVGSGAHLIALSPASEARLASAAETATAEAAWAHGVARIAARKLARAETTPVCDAEPLYVRNSVALTEAERAARAVSR
jgi:tRNA threonylcarbamoyladenosine biosynthesis protein TsaB